MSQVVLGWGFCLLFKRLWFCVFTVLYSLLVLFLVNHQIIGEKKKQYIVAACSVSAFHASKLDSLIGSGFQRAALDYAKIVNERKKTLFYKCFANLGSIDILVFWI